MRAEYASRLTLRPYQQEDLALVLSAEKPSALIANTMGTGKTLLAVEVVRAVGDPGGRALVIAPLNTHAGWVRTITGQAGPDVPVHHLVAGKKGELARDALAAKQPGWYIIGWEYFRKFSWYQAGIFDCAIADECHRAQNHKSKTAMMLWTVQAYRKLALSGTPAGDRIEGLWSTLHWLWPDEHRHFWPWVQKHMVTRPDPYVGRLIIKEKIRGGIVASIPTYTRRKLEDVVADLPERIVYEVPVPMVPAQAKIYREFESQAMAWLGEHPVLTPLSITHRLRLLQTALGVPTVFDTGEVDDEGISLLEIGFELDCKSNKITTLLEILGDIDPEEPVMVYTHSARFAEAVVHQLNAAKRGKYDLGRAALWTGKVPAAQRMQILKEFGHGIRFIVAGIAAIGEGVDGLQKVCNHEVWLSKADYGVLNTQAEGRLLRMGQTRPVLSWVLNSEDTIDTKVYERIEEKVDTMQESLGM